MNSGIYKITNKINGKFYIGSSIGIKGRLSHHKNSLIRGDHHSRHLQRAWKKYGENNFVFEIIEHIEDCNLLLEREQFYLDTLKPWKKEIGYNISPTAESCLGIIRTEKTKQKLRDINTGKTVSEETKTKISKGLKANEDWNKTMQSDEFKEKMRQANLAEKNPMWGGELASRGEDHYMWGKFGKLHHRARKIKQYTKEAIFIKEWDSLADAERGGFHHTNVSSCCKEKLQSAYGFIWRYSNDALEV